MASEEIDNPVAARLNRDLGIALRRGAVEEAEQLVQTHLTNAVDQTFAGYLANQRDWIPDAEQLQADGDVVDSGAVKKAVDLVYNRRFKGRRGLR